MGQKSSKPQPVKTTTDRTSSYTTSTVTTSVVRPPVVRTSVVTTPSFRTNVANTSMVRTPSVSTPVTRTHVVRPPSRNGLSRMYGYFKCPKCRQCWESSHVYCTSGTTSVPYGQECKKCKVTCNPYRVEKIVCSGCGETNCVCVIKKERHIDPNKHHRKDLCAKCKAGLPCT